MISKSSILRFALTLCVVALAVFSLACQDVGDKIVRSADKGKHAVEQLRNEKIISQEESDQLLPLIADVRSTGVEYASIEQAIKEAKSGDVKKSKREQLRLVGQKVLASVRRLNDEGVLRIKNEKARERVGQGLAIAEIVAELVV